MDLDAVTSEDTEPAVSLDSLGLTAKYAFPMQEFVVSLVHDYH